MPVASSDVRPTMTGRRRSDSCSSPVPPLPPSPNIPQNVHEQTTSTMTPSDNPSPSAEINAEYPSAQNAPQAARNSPPTLRVEIPVAGSYETLVNPLMVQLPESPVTNDADQEIAFPVGGEDMFFDDEGLTTLEKIYLYARSRATFHRTFISRSLPSFLPDVPPHDAVEYVLPLLNSLGTDEEESVKEAFVAELVPIMWWFFTNCKLVEDEWSIPPNTAEGECAHQDSPWPLIPVQVFTPLLGTLLLCANAAVTDATRSAVVELLGRLRAASDAELANPFTTSIQGPQNDVLVDTPAPHTDAPRPAALSHTYQGSLGPRERGLLERELLYGVVIGMARLDQPDEVVAPPSEPLPIHSSQDSASAAVPIPAEADEHQDQGVDDLDEEDIAALADEHVGEEDLFADPLLDHPIYDMSHAPEDTQLSPPHQPNDLPHESTPPPPPPPRESPQLSGPPLSRDIIAQTNESIQSRFPPSPSPSLSPCPSSPSSISLRLGPSTSPTLASQALSPTLQAYPSSPLSPPVSPFILPNLSTSPPTRHALCLPSSPPPASPPAASSAADEPSAESGTLSTPNDMGQNISNIFHLPYSPELTLPYSNEDTTHKDNEPRISSVLLSTTLLDAHSAHSAYSEPPMTGFFSFPSSPDAVLITSSSYPGASASPLRPFRPSTESTTSSTQSLDTPSSGASSGGPSTSGSEPIQTPEGHDEIEPSIRQLFQDDDADDTPAGNFSPESGAQGIVWVNHHSTGDTSEGGGDIGSDRTPPTQVTRDRSGFLPKGGLKAQATITGPLTPPKLTHEYPIDERKWVEAIFFPRRGSLDSSFPSPSDQSYSSKSLPASTRTSPARPKLVRFSRSELVIALGGGGSEPSSPLHEFSRSSRSLPEELNYTGSNSGLGESQEDSGGSSSDTVQMGGTSPGEHTSPDSGTVGDDDEAREMVLNSPDLVIPEVDFDMASLEDVVERSSTPASGSDKDTATSQRFLLVDSIPSSPPNEPLMPKEDETKLETEENPVPTEVITEESKTPPGTSSRRQPSIDPFIQPLECILPLLPIQLSSASTSIDPKTPSPPPSDINSTLEPESPTEEPLPVVEVTSRESHDDLDNDALTPNVHLPPPSVSSFPDTPSTDALGTSDAWEMPKSPNGVAVAETISAWTTQVIASEIEVDQHNGSPDVTVEVSEQGPGTPGSSDDDPWLRPTEPAHQASSSEEYSSSGEEAAIGRVASMSLIASVVSSGVLGAQSQDDFVAEVLRVGRDPIYWVRREAAFALGALAKVVPLDVINTSLLPLYEELTRDSIWHVRQSALFALPGILGRVLPRHRRELALGQCQRLAMDPSRSVRSGLLEIMGEVIYCFHEDQHGPPEELLDLFFARGQQGLEPFSSSEDSTASEWLSEGSDQRHQQTDFTSPFRSTFDDGSDSSSSDARGSRDSTFSLSRSRHTRDPERALICAFNFPAVIATLDPQRWHDIKHYYLILSMDRSAKVRRTLAASIGEIARMIGGEQAGIDLVPLWSDYLVDNDTEVRMKVLGALEMFVKSLIPIDQAKVADRLASLWASGIKNWREREVLACQFAPIARYFVSSGKGQSVRALFNNALQDPVAAVREAAIASCTEVFGALQRSPDIQKRLFEDLQDLSTASSFRKRVMYCALCHALITGGYDFKQGTSDPFWSTLTTLSKDPVVDVRIGVSRLVATASDKYYRDPSSRPSYVTLLIRSLTRDTSKEVKSYVSFLILAPGSPLASLSLASPPGPSVFATFSRPPPTTPLTDEHDLDDLMDEIDLDMDIDLDDDVARIDTAQEPSMLPLLSSMAIPQPPHSVDTPFKHPNPANEDTPVQSGTDNRIDPTPRLV